MTFARRIVRTPSVIACASTLLLLGGCQSRDAELNLTEALRAENSELRAANDDLQSALDRSQDQARGLVEEREKLVAENSSLREQLAAGASPAAAAGFDSGFAGDVSIRGSDIVVTVAGDVLFTSGSATLRSDARRQLDQIASVIQSRYSSNEIRIAGHTDNDPIRRSNWKTNERLSAERALAVEEYLSTRGVPNERMHIAGFGPAQPRGSKAQSRRVEIIVLGGVALALGCSLMFIGAWVLSHLRRPKQVELEEGQEEPQGWFPRIALWLSYVPVALTVVAALGLFVPLLKPLILKVFVYAVASAAVSWLISVVALIVGGGRKDLGRIRRALLLAGTPFYCLAVWIGRFLF
ncbi:MAG: OmpA family protein [Deltaproteobacteria bacterium]|nr:OmpA family protein [Deltaproteobacteria bacterium]